MRFFILVLLLILTGCSAAPNHPASGGFVAKSDTMEIIRKAAASAPYGVVGEYVLSIQATGKQGHVVYLNTELDYRDQRNVTVALHPNIIPQLEAQYGVRAEEFFIGKTIRVEGAAQRVRIDFINDQRKPSGKYYFQTHIRILNAAQIEVVNDSA
ncbi:hypothetical protein Q3O59_06865 [Alkalimonas delamerensis]|uniref:DUF4426 domain-containing protein n=1 Tax=Alkalimonas delamerensis TaxID=265981 RepID=A0ABT9GP51_9GAMM|nr:hypothetical protein [Alkalimonas delamerensis]MDP4528753.1 hypothetical protein [Alkalimonas delamerensis]